MAFSSTSFQNVLSSDIGINLLRSRSASVVIPFLFENFKVKVRQQIDGAELEDRLVDYIQNHINAESELEEDLDAEENEIIQNLDNKRRAKKYIDSWCSSQKKYLRRIVTNRGVVLLLDPAVDRMFSWLEKCQETQTVGAESRFNNILAQLRDLNQKTNQDTDSRIADLEKQKKEIETEIAKIKETGVVSNTYDKYQIQERLSVITQSSKDLLGDFNQIRTNFQNVINDIYNRQSEKQSSRGDILGYTLDTNDDLRKSPQGRSFTSFWNFISADTENEINTLVDSIMTKAHERGLEWNDRFLFNLSKYFFDSGNQIGAQNRLLTSRINKMLSFRESGDASMIRNITKEIKDNILIYNKSINERKINKTPIEMEIESDTIFNAMKNDLESFCTNVKLILEKVPPELAKDIVHSGIYLTGGTSQLHQLKDLFSEVTNIKVNDYEDPEESCVRGLGLVLGDSKFKQYGYSMKTRICK